MANRRNKAGVCPVGCSNFKIRGIRCGMPRTKGRSSALAQALHSLSPCLALPPLSALSLPRCAAARLGLSLHCVAHKSVATAFSHRPDRTRPSPQAQTWGSIWTKSDCSAAAPTWATHTPSLASVSASPSSRHLTSPASSCVKLPTPTCHTTLPTCASIWPCLARALACKTLAAVHTVSRSSA